VGQPRRTRQANRGIDDKARQSRGDAYFTEGGSAGLVVRPEDLYSDPHLKERGFFEETTHREAGTHRYPGMSFKFSKTPASMRLLPNCLGEHNEYVYREILGMSREEIAQLEEEKYIGDEFLPEIP